MNLGLTGKALVTAATGGLGFATAKALVGEGSRVVICGRDERRIQEAALRLTAEGVEAFGFVADVSRADDLECLFVRVQETLGGLDILVSNAGGPPSGGFGALDESQWDLGI